MLRKNSFIYKKEVFSPLEEVNDVIEIRNIVKQIIQDVYSDNYGYRLSESDALKLKTFIRNNAIDIQRIYDIKLSVLRAIIEEAKGLPLYFNRFFPVYCEGKKGKEHLLAINHSGVKLVLRCRGVDGEKLTVLESYKFDGIIDVQITTVNTVKILLHSGKTLILHTQWVYEINDIILAFIKESKLVLLSKVQKTKSNDIKGNKANGFHHDRQNGGIENLSASQQHQLYTKKSGKFVDKFNFLRKSRRNSVASESRKDTSERGLSAYLTEKSRTHSMKSLINIGSGSGGNNGNGSHLSKNNKKPNGHLSKNLEKLTPFPTIGSEFLIGTSKDAFSHNSNSRDPHAISSREYKKERDIRTRTLRPDRLFNQSSASNVDTSQFQNRNRHMSDNDRLNPEFKRDVDIKMNGTHFDPHRAQGGHKVPTPVSSLLTNHSSDPDENDRFNRHQPNGSNNTFTRQPVRTENTLSSKRYNSRSTHNLSRNVPDGRRPPNQLDGKNGANGFGPDVSSLHSGTSRVDQQASISEEMRRHAHSSHSQQNGQQSSHSRPNGGVYQGDRMAKNDDIKEESYEYNLSNCALMNFRTCLERIRSDASMNSWFQKVMDETKKAHSFYNLKTEYFRKYDPSDHRKLISFLKRPLDKPLLTLKAAEESRLSLECFIAIMRYMGDYPMSSIQSSEIDCVYTLLTASHRFNEIQNEVYCQIMKQLTENNSDSSESHIKGWKLMSIMTSYFYVKEALRPYLLHFLLTTSLDSRQSCSDIAKECLLNFETTAKYGGRKNVPGKDEILALSFGKSFKRQFYRIPGGGGRLFQLKSSTVVEKIIKDICGDLLEIKELKESEEFALYIVYPSKKVEYLNRNEYILDVTTELDKNYFPDTKNGYFVFFKRHIWSKNLEFKTSGQCYIEFHYKQILADYLAGLILMIPNLATDNKIPQYFEDDLAELACLIHRASGAETHPLVDDVLYLFPETLLENLNFKAEYWHSIILTIRKELNRLSPSEARINFMETLAKSSQLFGSTYFNVKISYDGERMEDRILAINKGGIYFLPPNAHQIISHHPYRRIETINKTVTPSESFIELKVKTSTIFKMLKIISDQCYEAFYMINWYMKKDFENGY